MPSLQSLRRKIGSVKNTQKITKAMKMVASAKLKRAQGRILAFRPYGLKMRDVVSNLSRRVNRDLHLLLQKRPTTIVRVVVVTSDRGLCGAFNANIIRRALEFIREREARGVKVEIGLVGRKGREFFRRRHWPTHAPYVDIFDRLTYEHGMEIAQAATEQYTKGMFDEAHVIYNEFKSALQQRVIVEQLFPIESLDEQGETGEKLGGSYLYEPDEHELLDALLMKHLQAQAFRILLESSAAEQAARMAAMDGATRNAGELITKLTLYYNKTRQAAITKELMDIVGGAEALK
ncbi:MAG: ATP synthase F1 subunit gamma [Nitrospirae bacterium]|nr:MAG: ATP synthase F1 subunit gamma [Nitrospirae bacterium 13_2_20CM_62_7]OLB57319.1 MAG: ATP synthase F1 subunit gamma [Nitrospirae bacterium 13_2_20CM_2_62_8]TLY42522.1 MAG: ATP synthase F1 subunit gamma [Nitrospirota bacterium]TLY43999.1 MAG: ATP synthase F1 subunit gamma [Nitrospirota bacterium]